MCMHAWMLLFISNIYCFLYVFYIKHFECECNLCEMLLYKLSWIELNYYCWQISLVFFACSLLPVSIVFVTFTWKQLPCWMSESTKPSQNHKNTHTLHRQTISTLTSTPIHTPTCWSKTPLLCGHEPKLWNTYTTRPFSRLTHCDKKHSLNVLEHVFGLKESHLHTGYELKAKRGT